MTDERRSIVLIPAHNEENTIGAVVRQVKEAVSWDVVVVDDASADSTLQVALDSGATVLPLTLQLGAWGAIQTGIRYALRSKYQTAVTMDADGQHEAEHINELLAPLFDDRGDVIIGACPDRVSRARRLAWSYFRLLTGLSLEDVTSGFRAYNMAAMRILASAEASLLDYQDVGVLMLLRRRRLRLVEINVSMKDRQDGGSRVFRSWWTVGKYMLHTSLLAFCRMGARDNRRDNRRDNLLSRRAGKH